MIEKDDTIKQLLQSSSPGAPAGFMDAVLRRVGTVPRTSTSYQPLVSRRLEKIFVYVYAVVAFTIISICAVLAFGTTDLFRRMRNSSLPDLDYQKIFLFIILFWAVYGIKALIERRKMSNVR